MSLTAIRYENGKLEILDQLLLPDESTFIPVVSCEDGWNAINKMQVRGAPAIAIVGVLSLAVELQNKEFSSLADLEDHTEKRLDYLVTARPTAVNMADARYKLLALLKAWLVEDGVSVDSLKQRLIDRMVAMKDEDVQANIAMGTHGADDILKRYDDKPVKVLTHCNTGTLATAGYGTALGVVRSLHAQNKLLHCFCTETRPYNQGSRLTAYELVHDKIPSTLICDSMASVLLLEKGISAVLTGADRVVANGDSANKIGTYQLAISAKYHNIPFYIVAPSTTVDFNLRTGKDIPIEERPHQEMTTIKGISVAAKGIGIWNPSFDVTPAELITGGIVTEYGVFPPNQLEVKLKQALKDASS